MTAPGVPEARPGSTLSEALDGTPTLGAHRYDLAAHGYTNEERFVHGTAQAYRLVRREPTGRTVVEPAETAAFTTRVVIRRPLETSRCNGTVVFEWLNVSAGLDLAAEWTMVHRHLMRAGMAWVGISAQRAGVEGGGLVAGIPLKTADPQRYGELSHPGDAYAFDIFTRSARAVLAEAGSALGGEVRRSLAMGESQSAAYLVTYINAVDPLEPVFDGFLIHGRGPRGAPLHGGSFGSGRSLESDARRAASGVGEPIRADVRVPVVIVQSETDVVSLGGATARQPDSAHVRLWEIAGTAHADSYQVATDHDDGTLSAAELDALLATEQIEGMPLGSPMNTGPQHHYVVQAALAHLDRWAAGDAPPPTAARLDLAPEGFATDRLGIATGGVRSPWVDVPLAVLSGLGQTGEVFAFLFGTTRPLSVGQLGELYPGGQAEFEDRFASSTAAAVEAGFLLEADAAEIVELGRAAYRRTTGAMPSA